MKGAKAWSQKGLSSNQEKGVMSYGTPSGSIYRGLFSGLLHRP
jgi:hypothetical protein